MLDNCFGQISGRWSLRTAMPKRIPPPPPPPATPEILEIIAPLFTSIDPLPPTAGREEIHRVLCGLGYTKDEATTHVDQMVAPERNESIYALSTSGPIGELIWTKRYHSEISGAMYLSGELPPEIDKMLALWSAICEELRARYGKPDGK